MGQAGYIIQCLHIERRPRRLIFVFFLLLVAEHGIQFSVYPDVLNTSGDWTKVYWNYVPNPSTGDWVGLFLVANNTSVIDPKHHAPTKYQVSQSGSSGMV